MEFMNLFVFYDISDDKLRKRFSEFLKNIGLERVQRSGFMGTARKDLLNKLYKECAKYSKDTIHVILLYKCRENAVLTFGNGWIPKDEDIIIV